MNVSHNQINRTDSKNVVRPDFNAFNELWERRHIGIVEFLISLAGLSISKAGILGAIVALSFIAGKIIEAGNELTQLTLIGALVVALMIFILALTVFFVEILNNAKVNKKSISKSTESTDERQSQKKTGKASRRNRSG